MQARIEKLNYLKSKAAKDGDFAQVAVIQQEIAELRQQQRQAEILALLSQR